MWCQLHSCDCKNQAKPPPTPGILIKTQTLETQAKTKVNPVTDSAVAPGTGGAVYTEQGMDTHTGPPGPQRVPLA